ncbi:MAG TPA: hypothetical protein P5293_05695 [Bacteroidales bacterium]|nr:hypothetical protein [Bacteroidales bacterium]
MKKTYTKNEIIEILLFLAEKADKDALRFENNGNMECRNISEGLHHAYLTTASWLKKINIKE